MREVDEANTEVQRNRILDAAARCLELKGVAKTSINDICREAGMRPGHLYYYFPSKDAVLAAVVMRDRDYIIDLIANMLDGPDIAGQIVDVHTKANDLRQSFGLRPVSRIELTAYFSRLPDFDEAGLGEEKDLIDAMLKAVRAAMLNGGLPGNLDVQSFVDAIVLIWQGLSYSRMADDFDMDRLARAARELIQGRLAMAKEAND
jgi:AcrR family transcriptional regulator